MMRPLYLDAVLGSRRCFWMKSRYALLKAEPTEKNQARNVKLKF